MCRHVFEPEFAELLQSLEIVTQNACAIPAADRQYNVQLE